MVLLHFLQVQSCRIVSSIWEDIFFPIGILEQLGCCMLFSIGILEYENNKFFMSAKSIASGILGEIISEFWLKKQLTLPNDYRNWYYDDPLFQS